MRRSDHNLETPRAVDWREQGACREHDPDLWYPRKDEGKGKSSVYATPRRICRSCPVWEKCRDYALEHDELYGMWGGLSPRERRALASKAVA